MSQILTLPEAAQHLRIQKVTAYKMCQAGRLPAFKIGTSWRFNKESLEKWIEGQERKQQAKGVLV